MEIVFNQMTDHLPDHDYEKDYQTIMEKAGRLLGLADTLVCSVIFADPEQIHEINREYRKIDRPTDVISFAMQDDKDNIFIEEEENELGDIFINTTAIENQAAEYGHSVRRESCFLFCHGLLHLLGYDHMTPEDEKVMFSLQKDILHEVADQ
ncbi:rRNA maturation RNase YbeY [Allobaculum mucilyticum]|uniref:rRNA maturation RNase YbeY n=1 Tax=Allobaculum mucilyticum TaxID=2834459 RepID=UPI001E614477|nr:rRNA maturation RNase YbeY [Allobaculum mucilyticum]UNT96367.1 rRNA maturation RNase YbeY [Allobaculum mucilyticum]